MPDKRLLPLSLMPLEIELSINPYGMYVVGDAGAFGNVIRPFKVKNVGLYAHVLFFE